MLCYCQIFNECISVVFRWLNYYSLLASIASVGRNLLRRSKWALASAFAFILKGHSAWNAGWFPPHAMHLAGVATAVCKCLKLLPKQAGANKPNTIVGKPETRLTGTPREMEWSGAEITDCKLLGCQKRLQILILKVHDRSLIAMQVLDPCPSLWLLLSIFHPVIPSRQPIWL